MANNHLDKLRAVGDTYCPVCGSLASRHTVVGGSPCCPKKVVERQERAERRSRFYLLGGNAPRRGF